MCSSIAGLISVTSVCDVYNIPKGRRIRNRTHKWGVCVLDQYSPVRPMRNNLKQANQLSFDGVMTELVHNQVICMLESFGE
jgi:hypothetical protein